MEYRMEGPVGARTVVNGRERDYFSGCSYLGLQSHPEVIEAAVQAAQRYGMSTGTSRGGFGEHPVYDALEAELRTTFDAQRVMYYPSGYMNAAVLSQGLSQRYERIFIDSSAHFSVWDGARASGRPLCAFQHGDAADLQTQLRSQLQAGERPLVLSDGVFPISGEIAPVNEYLPLVEAYDGQLCLDDAHASGVLGAQGRGTLEYHQISSPRCHAAHTLSKALGGSGGVTPGGLAFLEEVEQNSRVGVATSPPALPAAAASCRALALARTSSLRTDLRERVAYARAGLRGLGWNLADTPVPILCLGVRPGVDLARLQAGLFERDICVAHVRTYSSTPAGGALRIAIFATHSHEQIDRLVSELGRLL